jgi:hypothetical protein
MEISEKSTEVNLFGTFSPEVFSVVFKCSLHFGGVYTRNQTHGGFNGQCQRVCGDGGLVPSENSLGIASKLTEMAPERNFCQRFGTGAQDLFSAGTRSIFNVPPWRNYHSLGKVQAITGAETGNAFRSLGLADGECSARSEILFPSNSGPCALQTG